MTQIDVSFRDTRRPTYRLLLDMVPLHWRCGDQHDTSPAITPCPAQYYKAGARRSCQGCGSRDVPSMPLHVRAPAPPGVRVIRFIEKGDAARGAARHFEIGDSTAIRWVRRWRDTGSTRVKPRSRESRSRLKAHEQWLRDLVGQEPDLTLNEICLRLGGEHGLEVGMGSVWRSLRPPRH